MSTKKKTAKQIGKEFIESITAESIVVHPADKKVTDNDVVTISCAVYIDDKPSLFSIQVKHDDLKPAHALVTSMKDIIPSLKAGKVNFAYASSDNSNKRILYFRDSCQVHDGPASDMEVCSDLFPMLDKVRDMIVAKYEERPDMFLTK